MPVTAKLSRKFYDKLGDDIANELVEWFNAVDATYRSDFREMNELNFARFDAKVEQRWVELDAKITRRMLEFEAKFEQRLAELRADMQIGLGQVRAEMREGFAQLETRLTKRMFAFWVAQAATTAALVLGVVKLVR